MTARSRIAVAIVVLASLFPVPPASADSLIDRLLRIAGITRSPSQQKGPGDELRSGDIYVASLDSSGRPVQATSGGGYRWPVFLPGDREVLALRGELLVRVTTVSGEEKTLHVLKGVVKLVGLDRQDPDKVLVLLEKADGSDALGLLSIQSGRIEPLPHNPDLREHRSLVNHIRGQERAYGNVRLYVKTESKAGMGGTLGWTDVYKAEPGRTPQNVSHCDGVNCGQPSLSHAGRRVAFVRAVEGQ